MYIDTIYIEKEIEEHPRSKKILEKLQYKRTIRINRYTEIFNRNNQDFSLQKGKALILAKKYGRFVQKIEKSKIGERTNYYFSALLNCPFDCEYCFLKGLFRSSFYVIFVNYEDFIKEIESIERPGLSFAGYDSDSLALDSISELAPFLYESFKKSFHLVELRTKSTDIENLLKKSPSSNMVIAYSLNTFKIANRFERAPSIEKRVEAMSKLHSLGWQIGVRFDPLILYEGFEKEYEELFSYVLSKITPHSVTLGALRYPKSCFKNFSKRHKNVLLSNLFENTDGIYTYEKIKREKLIAFCENYLREHLDPKKVVVHHECS